MRSGGRVLPLRAVGGGVHLGRQRDGGGRQAVGRVFPARAVRGGTRGDWKERGQKVTCVDHNSHFITAFYRAPDSDVTGGKGLVFRADGGERYLPPPGAGGL